MPGAAAAQTSPTCTIDVSLFEGTNEACVLSLVPDTITKAEALKAAQARWDALAKEIGVSAALLWLGPRPKTTADIWWLPAG